MVRPTTLRLLSVEHDIAAEGWTPSGSDLLWRYNAHYFDDLNADGAAGRLAWHGALLDRWLHDVPPGSSPAWDPYPLSTRLVNWIKFALAGAVLPSRSIDSMAAQARWLTRRIEWHLQGNHLWMNGKALVFAGLFFQGGEADAWMELGSRILSREVDVQVLDDGGHFERSPMYHSLVLEDVLDLLNLMRLFGRGDEPLARNLSARVAGMRRWLNTMVHPDGEIAFFNDAAFGVAPTPSELGDYAARLGFPSPLATSAVVTVLRDSGYVRVERGPVVLIMDVGEVGPPFCPAHAHADTLSLELSLFGRRIFVNSGTSCYGHGEERLRQRGTRAHNTVAIEGADSSEVWSGFRVARRARPGVLDIRDTRQSTAISCSHDGYASRFGGAIHSRTVRLLDQEMSIVDEVSPSRSATARLHLHPDIEAEQGGRLVLSGRATAYVGSSGGERIEPSWWSPAFGVRIPSSCLAFDSSSGSIKAWVRW
jgi:uncharacterized heparinase superfamily protein